ncbi:MAG: RNA polymerase sigma factor RpoD/SigA [Spirochaetaceae bacterium]|nr:RNA polymerase sigma factor RpoD/SigA [Spirochaetaceae bacterium]
MKNSKKIKYDEDENALSLYLKEINEIKLLSHEEEIAIAKLAKAGDEEARALLAKSHLRFVVNVAKKFQNQGMSLADLISEGNLGLLQAIDRFDPEQGFHFISYAVWWIRQAIMKALGEKARSIRLPQNRANELVQIEKVRKSLANSGKEPEAEEIAQLLGLNKDTVQLLLNVARGTVSLDAPTRIDSDSSSTLGEFIPDNYYATPQELTEQAELKVEINAMLSSFLTQREARILELRFGLNGKEAMSLKDIGERFNLTKERIRQIEKKALARLQHPTRRRRLEAFVA